MLTPLFIPSAALALEAQRLQSTVRPVDQQIVLSVDPAQPTFTGHVEITLEVQQLTPSFRLHGDELRIERATLRRDGRRRASVAEIASVGDQLEITPGKPLKPGTWVLQIAYEGTIHDTAYGLYRFEHAGEPYVVTQLEADDARTAWPCFDEPGFKIPWKLTVTHPEGLTAISNAPAVPSAEPQPPGSAQAAFGWTPPVPSYAVALAVGPYVGTEVQGMSVPGTIWTLAGKEHLATRLVDELPGVVDHLEGWFGMPYPYAKLDFIAVPEYAFGAMENPGAVVIHEGLMIDPERETPERREALIRVAAHEVAHMWFGDLVTLAWWDDFWLNESFAEWMGERTVDAIAPEYRGELDRVAELVRMIRRDGAPTSRPIRTEIDPSAIFETANFAAYPKGEAVLDMIQAWIGPEVFQGALRTYLGRHAWGNAAAADLFGAFDRASGQPVGEILTGFLDAPGAPAVALAAQPDGTFVVTQDRYRSLGSEAGGGPWRVPLRLRVGRPDGSVEIVQHLLEGERAVLELGEVAWLHPAAEGYGYYAWSLDPGSMDALLGALDELSAPERRSVLGAMVLGVESGAHEVEQLLRDVVAFDGEPDPAIQGAIQGVLGYVGVAEDLDDPDLEAIMNAWRRERLSPVLEGLGYEAIEGEPVEVSKLRRSVLRTLAAARHPGVRAWARKLGATFLANPTSVDPGLAGWGLAILVEDAPPEQYDALLARAEATADTQLRRIYLSSAARVPGDQVRDSALALALQPQTNMADMFSLIRGVAESRDEEADREARLDWLLENYEVLASKLPPQMRAQLAAFGGGCSEARFERAKAFFGAPERDMPGMSRILAETEASVRQCLVRRERHGASVRAFLEAWHEG